ncbi:hypothetical protein ACFOSC_29710 [Streptantibioticus rubrisoli]|uniref:Integral membrane protein n=1 Tax=Streptantibioticus rubrisoli TaxID=1387313 RepID=A0ABT1PFX9_9ACTN|nr:hypothetical protein [Streptantibioticus rubrisoli]MCQ4044276.1 hypothetical protein [Streptantibioticus rubrisoli]
MRELALAAVSRGYQVLAVVNPGEGSQPPGGDKLTTVLGWVAWIVCGVCVAGVLMVAGRMAVMHNRGEGGQHMVGIAYVLGACVLVGAASALVGALV